MRKIVKLFPELKRDYGILVLIAVLKVACDLTASRILGTMTVSFETVSGSELISMVLKGLLFFAFTDILVQMVYERQCLKIKIYLTESCREKILNQICSVPVFSESVRNRNYIFSLLTSDTESLTDYTSSTVPTIISAGIKIVAIMISGLFLNPLLCLIYFAALLVGIAVQRFLSGVMEKAFGTAWEKQKDFYGQTDSILRNRLVFRTYQKEGYCHDLFSKSQNQYMQAELKTDRLAMPLKVVGVICAVLPILVLCAAGLALASNGSIEVGKLLSFYYFCLASLPEQIHYVDYMILAKQSLVSADKISDFLLLEAERSENKTYKQEMIEKVSFHYPDSASGINQITISFLQPEMIAVTGENGSGKSTLLYLLAGLLKPDTGSIRYMDSLLIPQEPFFFDGTIRENLCCGKKCSDTELWNALDLTNGSDFVRALEGQLDAGLTNNAMNLSGGQKQRLAIARAILHDHDLYLFDESLSACDPNTAEDVIKNLRKALKGKTSVFVLHQTELLSAVDRVIELHEGGIVFDGSLMDYREWKDAS